MRHVIAMGLCAALIGSCAEIEQDDPTTNETTAELGGANTVFAVQASAAGWWGLTIREDKVTSPIPNWKSVSTTFTLGTVNPGPPNLNLKYRVTAADEDTACAVGILIGLAVASGIPHNTAEAMLANANIIAQVDQYQELVPPGPPNINLGEVAHLGDMALHADRPGGGCITFDQGLIALGLPDGCTEDATPTPQLPIAGSFFALSSVGPGRSLTITETEMTPAADGNARFTAKYVLGVREAAIKPITATVVANAPDRMIASMSALAAGAGLLDDQGPRAMFDEFFAAGVPIKFESVSIVNPGPPIMPPEDIANMVDAGVAAVGPGGGCIVFGQAAGGLGFQMGCATGEH